MFNNSIPVALHGFLEHRLGTSAMLFFFPLQTFTVNTILILLLIGSPVKFRIARPLPLACQLK